MLRTFIACLVLSIAFCSCSDFVPSKKKVQVYTLISSTNDSLDKMTREWHQQLFLSTKDKSFARLRPYRIKIGQFLSRSRSEVAMLTVNKGSQNLLDSEEAFLATQANLFSETYSAFESYNDVTPNETINNQLRVASTNLSNMIASKAAIARSLQYYAQKNEVKINELSKR
ncbi:MAG: hypothetical protein JWQ38_1202 [Flavipsychrobacter sp.]|nr:hypothetical protein [Flavipsychrobacter sp.]